MPRLFPLLLCLFASACLSGCSDSDGKPEPELQVSASTKMLHFDWEDAGDGTEYRVQTSVDGGASFSDGVLDMKAMPFSSFLYSTGDLRFRLAACRAGTCRTSKPVGIEALVTRTIGVINAEYPKANARFGSLIALSGDGLTLAISQPASSERQTGTEDDCAAALPVNCLPVSGSVAIYVFTPEGWHLQAVLKASNADGFDAFGEAISLSRDGDTLAVGAFLEDSADGGTHADAPVDGCSGADPAAPCVANSGAVYLFSRQGNSWTQTTYLKASHPGRYDGFGDEIALDESGSRLLVGAMWEDGGGSGVNPDPVVDCDAAAPVNCAIDSGAAYVFTKDPTGQWTQQAYLKAVEGTLPATGFAGLIAFSGNGRLIAATRSDASGDFQATNLYADFGAGWENDGLYWLDDGAYTPVPALNRAGDRLAIGHPDAYDGGLVQVLHHGPAGRWTGGRSFTAGDNYIDSRFGASLAFDATGNLLAVGAPHDSQLASGLLDGPVDTCTPEAPGQCAMASGAVHLFSYSNGDWVLFHTLKPLSTEAFLDPVTELVNAPSADTFGMRVALAADGATLVVSAPGDDGAHAGVGGTMQDGCERLPVSNCVLNSGSVLVY